MNRPLVFIVDDDESIRDAFSDVLHEHGFEVHSYRSGREAVAALAQNERPGLILLDWMMPEMSGSEFVRQKGVSEFPVVIISAVADSIGEIPGVRERVNKPIGLMDLLHTVERHFDTEDKSVKQA